MLLLGFDYGTRRIGVALGESSGLSIRPLVTLAASDGLPKREQVAKLLADYRPGLVVVGTPIAGGEQVEASRRGAERLAMWLRKHFALRVEMCDESYTSVVRQAGDRDARAACEILREWINRPAAKP